MLGFAGLAESRCDHLCVAPSVPLIALTTKTNSLAHAVQHMLSKASIKDARIFGGMPPGYPICITFRKESDLIFLAPFIMEVSGSNSSKDNDNIIILGSTKIL